MAIKKSGHQTNKAFKRYCRVQNPVLEMAKYRAETAISCGKIIVFKVKKNDYLLHPGDLLKIMGKNCPTGCLY